MQVRNAGYRTRTVPELITHMIENYGPFDETERLAAKSRMNVPWEGGNLDVTILQIQETADAFELGDAPLSDTDKVDQLYHLINQSNLLDHACELWRFKPSEQKNWASVQSHFTQYASDRKKQLTASSAGYTANNAETALSRASGQIADMNVHMANLSERNVEQSSNITDLTARLAASEATLRAFQAAVPRDTNRDANRNTRTRNYGTDRNSNYGRHSSNNSHRGNGNQRGRDRPERPARSMDHYCSTHGRGPHASPDCRYPCSTHQNAATLDNRMGGSNANT